MTWIAFYSWNVVCAQQDIPSFSCIPIRFLLPFFKTISVNFLDGACTVVRFCYSLGRVLDAPWIKSTGVLFLIERARVHTHTLKHMQMYARSVKIIKSTSHITYSFGIGRGAILKRAWNQYAYCLYCEWW